MIAVIFEVRPAEGREADYLAIAATMRAELESQPGFIAVERFRSITDPLKLLSLSFWENEESVRNWRCHAGHRGAQAAGRGGVFAGYRLRVAGVLRDYGMTERREQAPQDSNAAWGL
jgi:heme-degrading monooxygenase HmoA